MIIHAKTNQVSWQWMENVDWVKAKWIKIVKEEGFINTNARDCWTTWNILGHYSKTQKNEKENNNPLMMHL